MDAKLIVEIAKDINSQPTDWWRNYRVMKDGVYVTATAPQSIWNAIVEGVEIDRRAIITRTITYPRPLSEPPEMGTLYYVLFDTWGYWEGSKLEMRFLEEGRVHLSEESRDAHEFALMPESHE